MSFHFLSQSFCERLNCFPSYVICCNYNLLFITICGSTCVQRTRAVLSCLRLWWINNSWNTSMSIHLLLWSFCERLNCLPSYSICYPQNLFSSELKLGYIVNRHNGEWSFDHGYCIKMRVMSISVRLEHIEQFPFNFVFSRVSLTTTNAVTELQ